MARLLKDTTLGDPGYGNRYAREMMTRVSVLIAAILLAAVAWQFMPARQSVGPPASKFMRCKNNLKQIGLAFREYHGHHGAFPPAFIADHNGKPTHSWRVLILPFMNQQALYDRYRFDEPWDGPNNSQLARLIPLAYRCPSFDAPDSNDHHTNYLAVVAANSVMSGETPVGVDEIVDPESSTILVTESVARTVHWMSPGDLAADDVFADLEAGLCAHTKGVNVVLADGSVPFLPQHIPKDEFEALVTSAGGEPVVDLPSHP